MWIDLYKKVLEGSDGTYKKFLKASITNHFSLKFHFENNFRRKPFSLETGGINEKREVFPEKTGVFVGKTGGKNGSIC